MLPRWHIFLGIILTSFIYFVSPSTPWPYLVLAFLASFAIDLDHYINAVMKTNHMSLFHSFDYYKQVKKKELKEKQKGIRNKGEFHLFHTIEFHILIAVLSLFWTPFFYVFLGMAFHSLCDFAFLIYQDRLYVREYFFFQWLADRF